MAGARSRSAAPPLPPVRARTGRRNASEGTVAARRVRAILVTPPAQWIKNLLVIAAAGAAGALGHHDVPLRVGLAFVAFCLLSAGHLRNQRCA